MAEELSSIFALEWHLENAFRDCSVAQQVLPTESCFISRSIRTEVFPAIEFKIVVGPVLKHEKLLNALTAAKCWDAWTGRLVTTLVTNRAEDVNHHQILGRLRLANQLFSLVSYWTRFQKVIALTDIREGGTTDSVVDDHLDVTQINWDIWFNVNPTVWPQI